MKLGDESYRLITIVPSVETGLYSVSLNLRQSIRAEMPLLLMREADLQHFILEASREPFLERNEPPEVIESCVRSAFRERMNQIAGYDPTIYEVASRLEEMSFSSPIVGRLPSAEIGWIVDTLADEFLYLGPLGLRQVLCSMSAQEGRFLMDLEMLLRIPSLELASYFGNGNSELALAQATQKLPGLGTKVQASEDRVSILVFYHFRRFQRGESEAGFRPNFGGDSVNCAGELEPAEVLETTAVVRQSRHYAKA